MKLRTARKLDLRWVRWVGRDRDDEPGIRATTLERYRKRLLKWGRTMEKHPRQRQE